MAHFIFFLHDDPDFCEKRNTARCFEHIEPPWTGRRCLSFQEVTMQYEAYDLWDNLIEKTIDRYRRTEGLNDAESEEVRISLWAALWLLRRGAESSDEHGMHGLFSQLVQAMIEEGAISPEDAQKADPTTIIWPPGKPAEVVACYNALIASRGKNGVSQEA